LRRLVVHVLKEINAVREGADDSGSLFLLEPLKFEIDKKTEKISNGLEELIRQDRIDVPMATSLMNDITYCRELCWDLVEAGTVLFSTSDLDDKAAMKSIALDEYEIQEMMESTDGENL
jgi:hypothetical protein